MTFHFAGCLLRYLSREAQDPKDMVEPDGSTEDRFPPIWTMVSWLGVLVAGGLMTIFWSFCKFILASFCRFGMSLWENEGVELPSLPSFLALGSGLCFVFFFFFGLFVFVS